MFVIICQVIYFRVRLILTIVGISCFVIIVLKLINNSMVGRSRDFSTPISRLTETFSRLLLFIHRGMCYDVVLAWQKRVVILSNNLLMFCVLVFHFRNEL